MAFPVAPIMAVWMAQHTRRRLLPNCADQCDVDTATSTSSVDSEAFMINLFTIGLPIKLGRASPVTRCVCFSHICSVRVRIMPLSTCVMSIHSCHRDRPSVHLLALPATRLIYAIPASIRQFPVPLFLLLPPSSWAAKPASSLKQWLKRTSREEATTPLQACVIHS